MSWRGAGASFALRHGDGKAKRLLTIGLSVFHNRESLPDSPEFRHFLLAPSLARYLQDFPQI